MVGRHLLAAISQGITAADEEVARAALGRIDWVLRGAAKRKLGQLLIDAALASGVVDTDEPEARRHLLRAAALILMGDPIDLTDADEVERAYADKTAVAAPRFPVASIAAGAVLLALSTTIAAATVVAATAPVPGALPIRPTPPPPAGAFSVGGSPGHEPAVEEVLVHQLPALIERRMIGREPAAFAHHPGVAGAWRELIDGVSSYDLDDRSKDPQELKIRVQVLSDQLAAANLGYFAAVERTTRNDLTIGVYKIAKVTFVRADAERVRVLDAQRISSDLPGGQAHPTKPVLGMKAEGMDDPVVLLDQVSAHVATQLLPVLDGHGYALADDSWARTARGRNATMAATRAIRRELNTALGNDAATIENATIRLRKLLLASVRHHEAQHGREQDKQPNHPEELAHLVGPLRDGNGRPNVMAFRARNELSAYTSQIASDMWLPQVALWNLARHAFQSNRRGTPESYAAVLVLEGMARQLGIASSGKSALHRGELDRDRLADLVAPLASRSTIELRSAAARLWAELFDEPLVRLVDDVFGE
jgi:hypothetical protein